MRVHVLIPGLLRSYTGGAPRVELAIVAAENPATLGAALRALDARFPGIAFRVVDEQRAIRRHIRMYVNANEVRSLDAAIPPAAEIMIVGALSGG